MGQIIGGIETASKDPARPARLAKTLAVLPLAVVAFGARTQYWVNPVLGLTIYCSEVSKRGDPPAWLEFSMSDQRITPSPRRQSFFLRRPALLVAIALAASGCMPKGPASGAMEVGGTPLLSDQDADNAVSSLGQRYAANPKDRDVALNYAAALRRAGRSEQTVAVLQKAAINFPDDREVMAAYGKALAADGQLEPALNIVRRAQTPDQPDWRLLSAEAAILDQIGQNEAARKLYRQALTLVPKESSILSNLGMSYVLTNELPEAEKYLRQAAALSQADSRVRQNLALVVGLQGRFPEAEAIARQELSPEQAEANLAYLRAMISQPNSWQKLKTASIKPGAEKS